MYRQRESVYGGTDRSSTLRHSEKEKDGLEEYLHAIDMGHNFETLLSNGVTSIEQLSNETIESLKRMGILVGNAVFMTRYMDANPPNADPLDDQKDDLEEYLRAIDMDHNFETLLSNGVTSIEQLSEETVESLKRMGILVGNAVFMTRYMDANPPNAESLDDQFHMMGGSNDLSPINRNDVFEKEGTLLPKLKFPKPYDNVKLSRHIGDFAFGTVWEVRQVDISVYGEPTGKFLRWAVRAQRGNRDAMEEGIRIWRRANARTTINVPHIFASKTVGNISLVLMEYTPAIPVDSAHKYLSKRWSNAQVKQKMQEAAGGVLLAIAQTLRDLHSSAYDRSGEIDRIFHLGIHEDNVLIKFDSMGNLSRVWLIDFSASKIKLGDSGHFAKEMSTDWGDLLLSFLKLYRNSVFGSFDEQEKPDIGRLKVELKKSPHVSDIIDAIGGIISKANTRETCSLDEISLASRERDVTFRTYPRDIVFSEDGIVIGFKTAHSDDDGPLEEILFKSPFLQLRDGVNPARMRSWEHNRGYPMEFRGNQAEGFVATKNKRYWRIRVVGPQSAPIYELYEEKCLDEENPTVKTPTLLLRINTRKPKRSSGTISHRQNVWCMAPIAGVAGRCATFADVQRHGRQCFVNFQLSPTALEVANDPYSYEVNDHQPHKSLRVAIGWQLVQVNRKKVNGLKSINNAFETERSPFETVFTKPEVLTSPNLVCQTENPEVDDEYKPKILTDVPIKLKCPNDHDLLHYKLLKKHKYPCDGGCGETKIAGAHMMMCLECKYSLCSKCLIKQGNWDQNVYIWERGTQLKYYINEESFEAVEIPNDIVQSWSESAIFCHDLPCPKGHELERLLIKKSKYRCKGCRRTQDAGDIIWECMKCKFRLCEKCHVQQPQCPKDHNLKRRDITQPKYLCTGCGKAIKKGDYLVRCSTGCEFYLCPKCHVKKEPYVGPVEKIAESAELASMNWKECKMDVTFSRASTRDEALFEILFRPKRFEAVGPRNKVEKTLACAFFPYDHIERKVLQLYIYQVEFDGADIAQELIGTLTHEFGHILGLRHEFYYDEGKEGERMLPAARLGMPDSKSVMNYYGLGYFNKRLTGLTDADKASTNALYELDDGAPFADTAEQLLDTKVVRVRPRYGI